MSVSLADLPLQALQELGDPAKHPDESEGCKEYAGVTRTLSGAGMMGGHDVAEEILQRGSEVHLATKYFDLNDLDLRTLPRDRKPFVTAWKNFRHASSFVPLHIEHPVQSVPHMVRGKLDRHGTIAGVKAVPECILEIASGHIMPYKRLQLAIYGYCYDPSRIFRRIGVELRAAGTYNVVEYPLSEYFDDVHTFLACIRVNEFKRRFHL